MHLKFKFSTTSCKFKLFDEFKKDNIPIIEMSTLNEEGVMNVRNEACELLLAHRVEQKIKSSKVSDVLNRLHVAEPSKRDSVERLPFIPESVLKKREMTMEVENVRRKLERELELELGDDYHIDLRKTWSLPKPEEKYDVLPEVWNGHNVADFIDPEIMQRLEELEEEEEKLMGLSCYDNEKDEESEEELKGIKKLAKKIREKRKLGILESRLNKTTRRTPTNSARTGKPVSRSRLEKTMESLGLDMSNKDDANYNRSKSRAESHKPVKRAREDSETGLVRSSSKLPRDKSGIRDVAMANKVQEINRQQQRKLINSSHFNKIGESDRIITTKMPKHLFSGKRKSGTHDRR